MIAIPFRAPAFVLLAAGACLALLASPGAGAEQVRADPSPRSIFLGPIADHLLDRSGALDIDDIAAERDGARFTPADGRVANYGPRPTPKAAFWLRMAVPRLDPGGTSNWVLTLNEPRTRRATLYLPTASGWSARKWALVSDALGTEAALRYPTFTVAAEEASERTVYLRIETPSSLRALVWIEQQADYIGGYAKQSTFYGVFFGILGVLCIYMLAIGLMTREGAYLNLSALILARFCYVAGDRGFIEVVFFPGAVMAARICSLVGTVLTFAFAVSFAAAYLRIKDHHPRIARASWIYVAAVIIVAAVAADDVYRNISRARFVIPYLGIATNAIVIGFSLLMMRREAGRAIAFLICWLPAITGALLRLSLDAFPAIGASPNIVNATYVGAATSLVLMAILTSLDLQRRERRLREIAQASEDRFRSFAGAASDTFWETDADGRLTLLSGSPGQTLPIATGTPLLDAFSRSAAGVGEDELAPVVAAMQRGQPFRSVLVSFATGEGERRHVLLSGTPVFAAAGGVAGFRGIAADVTELRNRREREAQQQKMAALGELAGGIAHEVNNLLHPIINLSRRVAEQLPSKDERRRYLDIVVDAGIRAGEIVAAVLGTARPSAESDRSTPLAEAVRRAIEAIRPMVPDAVEFRTSVSGTGGPAVSSGEVFQVLSNLIANAIYATRGAGRITVELARAPAPAGGLDHVLSVEDDGQGMDRATRQRALDPFFTTKAPGQGTGLGLPIVYGFVRGWGGTIDITSEPDRGTRITIRLPAGPAQEDERHGAEQAEGPGR